MRNQSLKSECKSIYKRIKIKRQNFRRPVKVLSAHYQLIISHKKGVDRNRSHQRHQYSFQPTAVLSTSISTIRDLHLYQLLYPRMQFLGQWSVAGAKIGMLGNIRPYVRAENVAHSRHATVYQHPLATLDAPHHSQHISHKFKILASTVVAWLILANQ